LTYHSSPFPSNFQPKSFTNSIIFKSQFAFALVVVVGFQAIHGLKTFHCTRILEWQSKQDIMVSKRQGITSLLKLINRRMCNNFLFTFSESILDADIFIWNVKKRSFYGQIAWLYIFQFKILLLTFQYEAIIRWWINWQFLEMEKCWKGENRITFV